MAGKRKANEAGSSNGLRGDVLRVLGVLKVATADQIQRLSSPHLTYRHTLKKTAAQRKEARTASHRGAANDLRRQALFERIRCAPVRQALMADRLQAAGSAVWSRSGMTFIVNWMMLRAMPRAAVVAPAPGPLPPARQRRRRHPSAAPRGS